MSQPPVFLGDRVVVRYHLGHDTPADWRPASGATLSDVTGVLRADGDPLIVDRDGHPESIPRSAVVSVRVLSRFPVRNSGIRAMETAAARAWPGVESTWIDGWFVRAGGGFTRRANSAIPLEFGARADAGTLGAIGDWYRERDLPVLLAVPERLLGATVDLGTPASGEIQILVRDFDDHEPGDPVPENGSLPGRVALDDAPGVAWVHAYGGADIDADLVLAVVAAADGPVTFASAHDDAGLVATGRAALTVAPDGTRWLGITALWSRPDARRLGWASTVMETLVRWGTARDANRAYVQVEAENTLAGQWYRRAGFGLHHRSRYVRVERGRARTDALR